MPRRHSTWILLALVLVAASSAVSWRAMRPRPLPTAAPEHHQHASASPSDDRAPRIDTTPPPGAAPAGMVWVPGGTFWMGCDDCGMPDARPVHLVRVAGFWMDEAPVTNAGFRTLRARNGLRHHRRAAARPEAVSRRSRVEVDPGLGRVRSPGQRPLARQSHAVVAVRRRRELAASRRQGQHDQGPRAASRGARGVGRCGRVLEMGGQGTAD